MRRPRTASSIIAVVLATAALALAACGGDDEGGGGDDPAPVGGAGETSATAPVPDEPAADTEPAAEQPSDPEQVEAAIVALLGGDEDAGLVCREVLTENLVQTAYGDLQGCLQARRSEPLARSVRRIAIDLDGDAARAEAIPRGGLYDGVTLEIEAVRDGDGWRIDGFVADVPVGP